jgi:hypothetical protein
VSPNLRRAAHQALDIILDALAEEGREKKTKKSRGRVQIPAPQVDLSPELQAQLDRQLARAGYRKAG